VHEYEKMFIISLQLEWNTLSHVARIFISKSNIELLIT